ncbi:MAG TPA: DUF456 family protein [Deltaproteobacteria bacterium]|nr:DUF456 family protein [Deltaproteobacteria bacterium]
MDTILAWCCAVVGLALGALGALVPGFPGCAVALLGLVAFAAITGFSIVTQPALIVACGLTVAGMVGQIVAPISAGRALGGSAGAATGAALGALLGALIPLPGVSWLAAIVGACTLGLIASRGQLWGWIRGVIGTSGGCLVAVAADLLAVMGNAAVLALCDFLHALP